jgi:2-polyprenyl-3-methyl-5-hydroxy-6-metoxy-1,4-benzoquinol methylase
MKCTICHSSVTKEIVSLQAGKLIYLCKNCHNAFTIPKPELPDYQNEDFHANGLITDNLTQLEALPEEIRTSYTIQVQLVEKYFSKSDRILEIGGGEGIFLDLLHRKGFSVEMTEPSHTAASRAMKRGFKVYNDYFQKTKFDAVYSLITMAHVLEHIPDPLSILGELKLHLKANGMVLLTQTNFRGFMPRFLKENWYAWVPEQHFSHFSISGIKYLADNSNFEVVDYKYSRLYHGKSIYHQVLRYIPFLQDQIHVLLKLKSA